MTPDGSCNMCTNVYAVQKAALRCKQKVLETAAGWDIVYNCGERTTTSLFPGLDPEQLDIKDGYVFEIANPENKQTLADVAYRYRSSGTGNLIADPLFAWAWHRQGRFRMEPGRERMMRQAHFMEVEVDPDTGEVIVKDAAWCHDVGMAVSPESTEGQSYGGAVMAISRDRSEECIYDPQTGVKLNPNLLDYKVATCLDASPIKATILETGMGYGCYGLAGIGEDGADAPATLLAVAVQNAIGVWVDDHPITPEKVLKALGKA
jgi:xanthine dehydrogenase molybdenum-binding subunit